MSQFVHLHVHSHYSLLTGLPKIPELVRAAKDRGFNALALTDYGAMYGAIEFYEACKKASIKPIIGAELFVKDEQSPVGRGPLTHRTAHLVLLAKDYTGYRNLMALVSRGHLEGVSHEPCVTTEMLAEHAGGLVALSGCMSGVLAQAMHQGSAALKRRAEAFEALFGKDNFYLELQDHPERAGQDELNRALVELGEATGIPLVVTRDVHYLDPTDREAQEILTCIRDGVTLDDPRRPSLKHVDRSLAGGDEIAARFHHVAEAIENTARISEKCSLQLPLGAWNFPPVTVPDGVSPIEHLRGEAARGLEQLVKTVTPELRDRLNYELDIIVKKGFAPYFLTVADYVKWARAQGIIATTRGSAAGSLVSYAMGITSVNPFDFKLPFERFLNPFRPSPPDIDVDFADHRRDEVIAYVTATYGTERVAQICTFGTMLARASVRDVGRALGIAYNVCDTVAKMIPFGSQGFPMTIRRALETTPELYALYNERSDIQRLLDLARSIEGCARHLSVHAAGVVIAPTALTNFTPVQREPGGEKIITQYEMYSVEKAGLLKMDFLGVRNLSILENAMKIVRKTRGVEVAIDTLAFDDRTTYEMLGRGETGGVFQLAGSGMTRYLKELKPSNIFDIMAMVALFRPGPMESIPEFIRRKHNPKLITYLDPRLKDILGMSYGVITYQDDVLLTAIHIAGYSWEEADKLRKAMGKKIPEEMAAQKEKFIEGCMRGGMAGEKAEDLWRLIEPFAAYGFNKSHAASYAVIAYHTAYMKAHFPEEYMAALLSAEAFDIDKTADNIAECQKMGIAVLPPDVNESFVLFGVVPHAERPRIRFGLSAIKHVGDHIAEVIIEERKAHGSYASLEDFLSRVTDKDLNKKSLESLIKCGAMDRFGERGRLMYTIEEMLEFVREIHGQRLKSQASLFGADLAAPSARLVLKETPPASAVDTLQWEKELLGLYVSAHPFERHAQALRGKITPLRELKDRLQKGGDPWVIVGGLVTASRRVLTKKGEAMAFCSIEDESGKMEAVLFPRTFENVRSLLEPGALVCLAGKVDERNGEVQIIGEKMEVLGDDPLKSIERLAGAAPPASSIARRPESHERAIAGLHVVVQIGVLRGDVIVKLKEILTAHEGERTVLLEVHDHGSQKVIETGLKVMPSGVLIEKIKELGFEVRV